MMFKFCLYHLIMLVVDVLLLRSVHRHAPTSLRRWVWLSFLGILAACVFGMPLGRGQLTTPGVAVHGCVFLFGSAALLFRQKIEDGDRMRRRVGFSAAIFLLAVIYAAFCVRAILIEPTALQVRHLTITTEKITRPMRILFMSDFQTDQIGEYERRTLLTAKAQDADLILWGGDYLQVRSKEHDKRLYVALNELLRETGLDAPFGFYAVKGNQELGRFYDWKRSFVGTKVEPIEKTQTIDIDEIRLTLLSMNASFHRHAVPDRQRGDKFRIMVGHCPSYAVGNQDADLLLAGHTHGGQLRIPGFGPVLTMSPGLPRKWASGLTELPNGSKLVVSHGTGMERGSAPRVRLNSLPDMWVIDLVPKEPEVKAYSPELPGGPL